MPKLRSFGEWQLKKLMSRKVAASYLNAALSDSPESFLKALRKLAQAHQMARVAKEAGVQRETLYRSLSEQGNPTLDTLYSVLNAIGLKILISDNAASSSFQPPTPTSINVSREIGKGEPESGSQQLARGLNIRNELGPGIDDDLVADALIPSQNNFAKTGLGANSWNQR
jgi:probable addiction module antidote protein